MDSTTPTNRTTRHHRVLHTAYEKGHFERFQVRESVRVLVKIDHASVPVQILPQDDANPLDIEIQFKIAGQTVTAWLHRLLTAEPCPENRPQSTTTARSPDAEPAQLAESPDRHEINRSTTHTRRITENRVTGTIKRETPLSRPQPAHVPTSIPTPRELANMAIYRRALLADSVEERPPLTDEEVRTYVRPRRELRQKVINELKQEGLWKQKPPRNDLPAPGMEQVPSSSATELKTGPASSVENWGHVFEPKGSSPPIHRSLDDYSYELKPEDLAQRLTETIAQDLTARLASATTTLEYGRVALKLEAFRAQHRPCLDLNARTTWPPVLRDRQDEVSAAEIVAAIQDALELAQDSEGDTTNSPLRTETKSPSSPRQS